jgi:hypothetical protein
MITEKAAKLALSRLGFKDCRRDIIVKEIEKAVSEILFGHPDHEFNSAYDEKMILDALNNYYFLLDSEGCLV